MCSSDLVVSSSVPNRHVASSVPVADLKLSFLQSIRLLQSSVKCQKRNRRLLLDNATTRDGESDQLMFDVPTENGH